MSAQSPERGKEQDKDRRGETTCLLILVALALISIIFTALTVDLIQRSTGIRYQAAVSLAVVWICWDLVLVAYVVESMILLRLLAAEEGHARQDVSSPEKGERTPLLAQGVEGDARRMKDAHMGYMPIGR